MGAFGLPDVEREAVEEAAPLLPPPVRVVVTEEEEEEELQWNERVCAGTGFMVLSALCTSLGGYSLNAGQLSSFATMGTLSVVFSLLSAFTFFGVRASLRAAFDEQRRAAFLMFITALILTFLAGYHRAPFPILILCVVSFYMSQAWYVLTYIPYGRDSVRSCGKALLLMVRWL